MPDEAYYWAAAQFGAADLGDARRTDRLVSTMAAIARAPDESLPRQLGSVAGVKAAYRLFDCGAVTREAVMDPHLVQCRAEAARHPIVLMVHDDTTLDFSTHRRLKGAGRVGDDRGTGFLAHSCLAVLPAGAILGLAHQAIWARPPKGVAPQTRESAVWAETGVTIGRPPVGTLFVSVADRGADVFEHLESVRQTGWDAVVRAAQDRRLVTGGGALTALRAAPAMGAATVPTRQGEVVVCVAWRDLQLLPPRPGPADRAPLRVRGVPVWNDTLEWLLLTTRPVESLDQALEIIVWYSQRWRVEEFHKAWKTGCRAEQRQLEEADRLVPLLGALAIVAVRLLGLRDAARRDGAAPADVPETTIRILAAKLQRPPESFATNRAFLRGVARLGGFLARKSDGEPGWQTIWKGWCVLRTLIEGFELAQAIASSK
ncbi:MAG TPA: IS4 family transposase [Isosphaeraceae bacterium]|nr:IS4 family transposase [Isosphaeraceae bacterium]